MDKHVFVGTVFVLLAPALLFGQSPATSDDLTARMNRQDAEIQALREEVTRLRENPVRLPAVAATPAGMESAPDAATGGVAVAPAP